MRIFLILFSLLSISLLADSEKSDDLAYSLRLGGGFADFNDLGEILQGDWNRYGNNAVVNLDVGYRFIKDMSDFPLDWYIKGGLSYFNEDGYQDNFLEATLYVKVYWKLDFWHNRARIGFGEGLSLAQELPEVEIVDATNADGSIDPTAKFLNYLDISADFDIGRLIKVKSMKNLYLGYTLKHRSGVFGTFNGVHGGSNYNMLTIEKNF